MNLLRLLGLLSTLPLSLQDRSHQLPLGSQSSSYSPFSQTFDARVQSLLNEWHTPGLAIGVVHGNETWLKGYGIATFPNEPVTAHTLFYAGSTTKSHTASIAALVVDNDTVYKDIHWTTPLHSILNDDFKLQGEYETTHITIEDALSHRTGMPRHDFAWTNKKVSNREQTRALRYLPATAELRTQWQYSNMMYTAVTHMLETLTGEWLGDLLHRMLWKPLGMTETFLDIEDAAKCQDANSECIVATGYTWQNRSSSYWTEDTDILPEANGAGGVITNVQDYSKWVRALINEDGPVPKSGHHILKHPHSVLAADSQAPYTGPQWYGFGLTGSIYRGERVFGHNGAIGSYLCNMLFLPDRDWGLVVLQNAPNWLPLVLSWQLVDDFLGTPDTDRQDINKMYHDKDEKAASRITILPSVLYPNVTERPIALSRPLSAYAGTYLHPGYGNITLSLGDTSEAGYRSPLRPGSLDGTLVARTKYLGGECIFSHVSGEHWLVDFRYPYADLDEAVIYTKAKFEVGPSGTVERVGVIVEAAVQGEKGWAWFERDD